MQTTTQVTHEEYFDLLAKSDVKLEYHAGEILAMAGAQPAHNLIVANITIELGYCLKKKGCLVYTSDQLIRVEKCDRFTFPDLVIICKKPVYAKSSRGLDSLENPEIIIEVLSDSTEHYDRLEKFDCYKTISTFREYILISSKKKKIEIIRKLNESEWLSHIYTNNDESVIIDNCSILLEDIYRGIELSDTDSPGF
ncbi:Uma2 family endonuclease [Dyadobacter sp. CY356]|uniref:Uma2 family endonuclease n=1 Tax=Dyadobacter sp. CY356 TaxID=2906442 RepID=UPI001F2D78D6|nr:Uma2 family endonuclease [Dyadobacter sp. CY356]MCF0059035.1 Uma2 family endonuclease [Dyadobacter sp. CY356]